MYKRVVLGFLLAVFALGTSVEIALACGGDTPVPCTAVYPDGRHFPACCPKEPN